MRIARGSQYPSLVAAWDHETGFLKGLNRMLSAKYPSTAIHWASAATATSTFLKHAYCAHLDDEGDTETIHIHEICDADLKSPASLQHHMRDLHAA
jgi:hypothetical protein